MALEDIEAQATGELKSELTEHLEFNSKVWALVVRVIGAFQGHDLAQMPESRKVCFVLLARLANDLRCVALLSERGYSEQAAIIAASVFEIAHTICYIRDDEERALAWIQHREPKRAFKPIAQLIRATAEYIEAPNIEQVIRNERRNYAQLCWPKHASPLILGFRPPEERQKHGTFYLGPDTTDFSVRTAWFALQHSGRHGLLAVDVFQNTHATVLDVARAVANWRVIYDQLVAQAQDRWGTDDPFQGEW
ncbi:MAG: STAS/SEC14 domain-containing protein [Proteobacteria bacterium]|nr:STAS/SEC14 domain-containing protein [Pseudomonadota bacterium]